MDDIKILIPFVMTQEFVDNVMSTAIGVGYGGCWYWIDDGIYVKDNDMCDAEFKSDVISRGGTLIFKTEPITDCKDDKGEYTLNLDKFVQGYKKYVEWSIDRHRQVFTDTEDIDGDTADTIVQFAIFGELVFG